MQFPFTDVLNHRSPTARCYLKGLHGRLRPMATNLGNWGGRILCSEAESALVKHLPGLQQGFADHPAEPKWGFPAGSGGFQRAVERLVSLVEALEVILLILMASYQPYYELGHWSLEGPFGRLGYMCETPAVNLSRWLGPKYWPWYLNIFQTPTPDLTNGEQVKYASCFKSGSKRTESCSTT